MAGGSVNRRTEPYFIGYMGDEIGWFPLYNVPQADGTVDTWSAETLREKGIPIPLTPARAA